MGSGGRVQPGKSSHRSSVSSVSSQAKLSQSSSNSHSLLRKHAHTFRSARRTTRRVPRTTHRWFSILCISSLIWLPDEPPRSSSLATPASLSDVLTGSSHSLPLKDSGVCFRRQASAGWLLGGCGFIGRPPASRAEQEPRPSTSSYLVHVNDAIAVPLLSHVAETSGDVDPAADVHVHLHGLLLDLAVQLRQVLSAGKRGSVLRTSLTGEKHPCACGRERALGLRCSSGL